MKKVRPIARSAFSILIALFCFGCASTSSNFKLSEVPKEDVPFMGHIDVFVDNLEQTEKCYASFTDEHDHRKAYINLDKTGWVFAHAKPGLTILSSVVCTEGTLFIHPAQLQLSQIRFVLPDTQQISYFGHIRVMFADKNPLPGLVLFGVAGAVTQAAIAGTHDDAPKPFAIESKMSAAQQEYQRRFGADSGKPKLVELSPLPAPQASPVSSKSAL